MPATNIQTYLSSKPVSFKIKTAGGTWACELHENRASYDKKRATLAAAGASTPDIEAASSGLSNSSSKASSIHEKH